MWIELTLVQQVLQGAQRFAHEVGGYSFEALLLPELVHRVVDVNPFRKILRVAIFDHRRQQTPVEVRILPLQTRPGF